MLLVGSSAAFAYVSLAPTADAKPLGSSVEPAAAKAELASPLLESPHASAPPPAGSATPTPTPSAGTTEPPASNVPPIATDPGEPPVVVPPFNPVPLPPPTTAPQPPSPPRSGKPNAGNTGVPAGTVLTPVHGDVIVTTPGTVIDSVELFGALRIQAANVTVKRSILHGSQSSSWIAVYAGDASATNLVLQDDEISPTIQAPGTNGIFGHNFSLYRVNIHNVVDSMQIFAGGNVRVDSSYLHDNTHFSAAQDNSHPDGSHDDNIQVQNGTNISITNSVLSGANNSAVIITQGTGAVSNVAIRNNWIDGGGCAVNIADGSNGPVAGLNISGNVFGATRFNCQILVSPAARSSSTLTPNTLIAGTPVGLICSAASGNYHC